VTVVVTNDDGVESPGIHALAAMLRRLGHEPVVVAPTRDMSGASAAIGRIELDRPTRVTRVTLPEPAADVVAYAIDGPPGLAALLAARGGIDGVEPAFLVSGINMGTNTGHSVLHSGTVGAALTAATFGLSALAVSLSVSEPMVWEAAYDPLAEALELLDRAPRATVLNVNVPAPRSDVATGPLRWAQLDRFGSFRVAVAERRDAEVQLEYRARGSGHRLDPNSDTALVASGVATVTALQGIRAVPPDELPFAEPPPIPEPRLAPGPGEARPTRPPG
jgi:5'/3'-nucleotidase